LSAGGFDRRKIYLGNENDIRYIFLFPGTDPEQIVRDAVDAVFFEEELCKPF